MGWASSSSQTWVPCGMTLAWPTGGTLCWCPVLQQIDLRRKRLLGSLCKPCKKLYPFSPPTTLTGTPWESLLLQMVRLLHPSYSTEFLHCIHSWFSIFLMFRCGSSCTCTACLHQVHSYGNQCEPFNLFSAYFQIICASFNIIVLLIQPPLLF